MDLLDRLLGHDKATTDELLTRCAELSPEQWDQEIDVGWSSAHATLGHMIFNERTWTELMAGRDASSIATGWTWTLNDLIAQHEAAYAEFSALARDLRDTNRWDDVFIDTLDDPPTAKTYGGGVLHVILHNMHHRAELLHLLDRLGLADLPPEDLMAWDMDQVTAMKGVV
jgi:uncharacterized damage-inducible protein DinB